MKNLLNMTNYQLFPEKKRTIKTRYRSTLHALKKIFSRKGDIAFTLRNIPVTYWVLSNTFFSRQLTKWGGYEIENSNWVLDNFSGKQGGLFVDVGANFGWYSLIFSMCAGPSGRVVSIEPEPENLRLLNKNIATNNATNISVITAGVGASDGVAELSLNDQWNPGMHSLRQSLNSHDKVEIEIKSLDNILKDFPGEIDLLKMDIEGFEVDALMGAHETLARTKCVLIEYTPKFIRACGRDPNEFLTIFENHKFVPYCMSDGKLTLRTSEFLNSVDSKLAHLENPQVDIFYIKL
ncbi:MAG: FkbM family methyltransferase [Methylotenera sp.]|nr:FkbM family methyltransferase [Methylotenera sp.]